jgi:hypothetical protein
MGLMEYHEPDIEFQRKFFTDCREHINGFKRCIELGAGPGRVTYNLLSQHFDIIDINDVVKFTT